MDEADYVIVGAGPAGCALARRLADADPAVSVILVEAGPPRPSFLSTMPLGLAALISRRSRYNYGFVTVPQSGLNGRCGYVPRGRGVGGSSLINAMCYIRGQREDYDGWSDAGCTGWSWSDVLPLFRRSEANVRGESAFHGGSGPLAVANLSSPSPAAQAFIDAAIAAGFPGNDDFNGAVQEGIGFYQVFQRNGRRLDAGRAYLHDGKTRSNLSITGDTVAERIIFRDRRAVGVAVRGPAGRRQIAARREVILSAGTIASPQLLMLSGIGDPDSLRGLEIAVVASSPEVGRNLQDHLDYTANVRMRAPGLFALNPLAMLRAAASLPAYYRGKGTLTSNAAEAGGFVRSDAQQTRPDLQFHFTIALADDHGRRLHVASGAALHVCALRPKSRGRVGLSRPDIAAEPLIDPNFLSHPDDLGLMMKGARIVHRIWQTDPLARYHGRLLYGRFDADDAELAGMIRAHADTIYHPVGTCRMGADEASVVDAQLRVRGVEALRVADASIMPTLVSGNTQAPSAMIGEKAADLIVRTWA